MSTPVDVAVPIRCPGCNRLLGALAADGAVIIEHRKRRIVVHGAVSIECEDCGTTMRHDAVNGGVSPAVR